MARQLGDLEAKERTLEDALRRRQLLPADLPFGTPFMEPVDDSLDNLLPLLNDYQDTWQALQRIDGQIEALYAQVRLKGVAKFDSEDDTERRLKLLINAYAHRQDEALTLAKARRAAVTDIARTLRNIRSDYDNLEHQLALFNREINKRQVSNLQSFRIVLAPNKDALKHIDQIIHSAGQYEEGENLSVFDLTQSAEQDAKNEEAKEYLARLVAANHNQLGLKDLFELAFEITKVNGQPIMHRHRRRRLQRHHHDHQGADQHVPVAAPDGPRAGRARAPALPGRGGGHRRAQPGRAAGDQPATGLRADPGEREAAGFRTWRSTWKAVAARTASISTKPTGNTSVAGMPPPAAKPAQPASRRKPANRRESVCHGPA